MIDNDKFYSRNNTHGKLAKDFNRERSTFMQGFYAFLSSAWSDSIILISPVEKLTKWSLIKWNLSVTEIMAWLKPPEITINTFKSCVSSRPATESMTSSIGRSWWWEGKGVTLPAYQCKSLWIKAAAKWINITININPSVEID